MDIGTGANCIYPILGISIYGWACTGSDIDQTALNNAKQIKDKNKKLKEKLTLKHQPNKDKIFENIIWDGEYYDLTMCNPPFHSSAEEAAKVNIRKNKNLGIKSLKETHRNFKGHNQELWYPGGELAFIKKMVKESQTYQHQVLWFSSIISNQDNIPRVEQLLQDRGCLEMKIVPMAQGQKKSRFIAWTFMDAKKEKAWIEFRWN